MGYRNGSDTGVSELVGEMLMIALVIVLLSVFSATLYTFLPADRAPSVTIKMSNDRENVTLWHKGGDWVKAEDLTIVISNATDSRSFSQHTGGFVLWPDKSVFDLGSTITVQVPAGIAGDETVKLVTPRAAIYSGRVRI